MPLLEYLAATERMFDVTLSHVTLNELIRRYGRIVVGSAVRNDLVALHPLLARPGKPEHACRLTEKGWALLQRVEDDVAVPLGVHPLTARPLAALPSR